jgi:FlaA1/EpsC-like NDP-sugar epimerase
MYKNILITGAGGTVGYELTNFYLSKGATVYAVDRSEEGVARLLDIKRVSTFGNKLNILYDDILNISFKNNALGIKGVQVIIHCAALKHFSVGEEFPEKVFQENINVFKKVVELAREHKDVEKVAICSSDKAAQPTSAMGKSKKEIEDLCRKVNIRDVAFVNVRFANILYSSGSLFQKLEESVLAGREFLVRDKRMTRYVFTKQEVIQLVDHAMNYGRHGDVICLSTHSAKVVDLISVYLKKRGLNLAVTEGENIFNESLHEALFNKKEVDHVSKANGYLTYNTKYMGDLSEVDKLLVISSNNAISGDSLKKIYE